MNSYCYCYCFFLLFFSMFNFDISTYICIYFLSVGRFNAEFDHFSGKHSSDIVLMELCVCSSTFMPEHRSNVYIPKVSTIWRKLWNKWKNDNVKIFLLFVYRSDCLTFWIFHSEFWMTEGIQFMLKSHTKEWNKKRITSKHEPNWLVR